MKVLIVYAHHNPGSFCHAVLDRFSAGLTAAGHTSRVVDLYASHFDPVFRARDSASYIDPNSPPWVLELMDPRRQVLDSARDPLRRWLAARAIRGKSQVEIAALIRKHMPKDVLAQQRDVAWADALAFIAPIYFCGFPAILMAGSSACSPSGSRSDSPTRGGVGTCAAGCRCCTTSVR